MAGGIKLQVDLDMVKFQTQLNSLVSKANSTVINPKMNTSRVSTYTKNIKTAATSTESLGQKILEIPLKFFKWYAISGIVTGAFGAVRDGITDVISLDTALTNISFTMELTSNELNDIATNSNLVANSLASTSDKVLEATQIYSNMNETLEEINDKSQASIILSNITGESITDMANAVQGSVYAFDLQASAAGHVADVMSKIASTTGVAFNQSIKSMTDSISIAGGVANEVGLSFEQFAAIVATTQEKTRMSGAKIASGLTTVFSRITRVSELGAEEISALEGGFKKLGITIRDQTTGEFLDMWEILQNINNVWGDLNSTERSYVAELSAGVRQRKVFLGVLNSMTGITERASDAMISSGFAMEQNDKFVESLSGKLNLLSEAQSNFFRTLIDSETIGEFIDSLTSFLNTLTGIANAIDDLNLKLPVFVSLVSIGITVLTTKFGIFNGVLAASNPPLLALTAAVAAISFVYETYSNKLKETTAQAERAKIAQEQYNKVMNSGSVQNIEDMNGMIAELAISYDKATTALSDYNSIRGDTVDANLFNFANVSKFRELTDNVNEAKLAVDAFNLSEEELNKIVADYKSKEYEIRGETDGRHKLTSAVTEQIKEYYNLLDAEKSLEITRNLTIEQLEELSSVYPEAMESLIDAEIKATDTVLIETQKRIIAKKLELEAIQSLSVYSSKEDTITSQQNDYAFFRKNLDIIDESKKRLDELNSTKEKYFETSTESTSSTSSTTVDILTNQAIALSDINRQIDLLESKNNKTIDQEKELKSLYNDKLNALSALADSYREQVKELDPLSKEYDDLQNTISGLSVEYNNLEAEMLGTTDAIIEQQEVLENLVSDAQDNLVQSIENEIEALENKKDALTEEYEARKDINDQLSDQIAYERKLASFDESISDAKLEYQMLLLDNSVEANARREELAEQLAEDELDRSELIEDRDIELRDERITADYEAEKKLIEDKISLNEDMIEDIESETTKMLQNLTNSTSDEIDNLLSNFELFNKKYSKSLTSTVASAWDNLTNKVKNYGTAVSGATGIENSSSESESLVKTSSTSGYDVGTAPTYSSSTKSAKTYIQGRTEAQLRASIASAEGQGIPATSERAELSARGIRYHDGLLSGKVGSSGISNSKDKEIATILQEGESVLTGDQYSNMGNILESTGMIGGSKLPSSVSKINNNSSSSSITYDALIKIENMSPVLSNDVDVASFGQNMAKGVEKQITNSGIVIPSRGR